MYGLILVGAGIRLIGLGAKSFWVDEIHSLSVSQTLEDIIWYCRGGHTPPLRYLLVWALQHTPNPEFTVRLPALLFGTLSIALVLWLGEMLRDWRTGVVAAILLLLSPWHLDHSQDARYYAVILFLALAALGLTIRILERPKPLWRWILLAIVCALNFYLSYVAIFSVAAMIGYLAWCAWKAWQQPQEHTQAKMLLRGGIVAALVGLLILSPWLSEMIGLVGRYVREAPDSGLISRASASSTPVPVQPPIAWETRYDWAYANDLLAKLGLEQPVVKWALLAFFVIGLIGTIRRKSSVGVLTGLWFILPWAVILTTTGLRLFCPPRYLIHYLGLYLLLAAAGILIVWDRLYITFALPASVRAGPIRQTVFHAVTATIALLAFLSYAREDIRYLRSEKQDWRSVVRFLDQNALPSEAVLAGGYWTPLGLFCYESELSKPTHLIDKCVSTRRIERELALYPRVWYVTWGPVRGDVAALLAGRFELIREFPGMKGIIQVYRAKSKSDVSGVGW